MPGTKPANQCRKQREWEREAVARHARCRRPPQQDDAAHERAQWTIGWQRIEEKKRALALEQEVKSLRRLIDTVLCYVDRDDLKAIEHLMRHTPSNAKLKLIAAENPPPAKWFEGDEERPW